MTREHVRGVPADPARRARGSAPAACLRVVRRGALVVGGLGLARVRRLARQLVPLGVSGVVRRDPVGGAGAKP
ncbi:hypothetical protein [Micromonospora rubida]